ncbi:HD domain-containing protein [Psychroserpens sp.]|uniref:HD domain-containing protein n=1 Tax=Psychroserpens sp. TaxID=2020870 RepID=UPI00385FB13E
MKLSFNRIKKHVIIFLEEGLSPQLYYHGIPHTLYVIKKAQHIALKEKVSAKEIELLKIAALYHDVGFVKTREGHEEESCKIAAKDLKSFGYSQVDIDIICEVIMATKVPQNPTNHLGEILADADLEYLATKHFDSVSDLLYKELKYFNPKLTKDKWNELQIDFIGKHNYHTKYCKHYKAFRKNKNLQKLKSNM